MKKIMRMCAITILIIPAIAIPSAPDGQNKDKAPTAKRSWARSLALPVAGAAVGTAAVWAWLKQQPATRNPDGFSGSLHFAGAIGGFSFGIVLDNFSVGQATSARPARPQSGAHALASSLAKRKEKQKFDAPAEPESIRNVISVDKYYSRTLGKWVVCS